MIILKSEINMSWEHSQQRSVLFSLVYSCVKSTPLSGQMAAPSQPFYEETRCYLPQSLFIFCFCVGCLPKWCAVFLCVYCINPLELTKRWLLYVTSYGCYALLFLVCTITFSTGQSSTLAGFGEINLMSY
jgi:hypothetical protein